MGILEQPLHISWLLKKSNISDKIFNTRLYLGKTLVPDKLLYTGVIPLNKENLTKQEFGNHIKASFKEPYYYLSIDKWHFTVRVTFTLVINQEESATLEPRPVLTNSVEIIPAKGINFL